MLVQIVRKASLKSANDIALALLNGEISLVFSKTELAVQSQGTWPWPVTKGQGWAPQDKDRSHQKSTGK